MEFEMKYSRNTKEGRKEQTKKQNKMERGIENKKMMDRFNHY